VSSRGRPRVSLRGYLRYRLGPLGGRAAWFNFFLKPFGATSFAEFWRLWNPVYGYYLMYYCYRPMVRVLPRPVAVILTFAICGFVLHDLPAWAFTRRVLPPGATIAFTMFGLGAITGEALHMNLSRWPVAVRALINVTYLAACVAAMLIVVLELGRSTSALLSR
jgi:D-alanyl-lipoteichoic acid acyltransferase DltB (MBOAT superfamily)